MAKRNKSKKNSELLKQVLLPRLTPNIVPILPNGDKHGTKYPFGSIWEWTGLEPALKHDTAQGYVPTKPKDPNSLVRVIPDIPSPERKPIPKPRVFPIPTPDIPEPKPRPIVPFPVPTPIPDPEIPGIGDPFLIEPRDEGGWPVPPDPPEKPKPKRENPDPEPQEECAETVYDQIMAALDGIYIPLCTKKGAGITIGTKKNGK